MSVEYLRKQLGDNERILYTERHHWIFPLSELIKWILLELVVLALLVLVDVWLLPDPGWVRWGYLVLILPLLRIAVGFISWRANVFVLTNRRVVESTGVVNKTVMDSSLEKLNDVVLTQRLFGRILGYGDIEILTAASGAGVNDLRQIRHPPGIQDGHGERERGAGTGVRSQRLNPAPANASASRRGRPYSTNSATARKWHTAPPSTNRCHTACM